MRRLLSVVPLFVLAVACHKAAPAGAYVVAITADDDGFSSDSLDVKRGKPLTLRFTRTSKDTCADRGVFPALHLEKELPLDHPWTSRCRPTRRAHSCSSAAWRCTRAPSS